MRVAFSIGGCAYRMMVSCQHAGHVALLAAQARTPSEGCDLRAIEYMHTSNLPQGRCAWLRDQIAKIEIDAAITMDSDTWFVSPPEVLRGMRKVIAEGWAIGIAPVRQGGDQQRCNLRAFADDDDVIIPLTWAELGERFATSNVGIAAGGFGLAVHNLAWYRKHWPLPSPETASFDSGEDMEHCRSLRRRGGKICALAIGTEHAEFRP